jgi:hypothetical protein
MTSYLRYVFTAGFVAAAFVQAAYGQFLTVPPVPTAIQVQAGNIPFLKGHAVGTQDYVCLPSGSGFAWTFFGPQATLFLTLRIFQTEIQQQITTHFLSPNPDESGTARATWQSSFDTSAVWARAIATSTDPDFIAPGAIPWLLLQVVGSELGPTGGAFLTQTTFIHRLNTSGGVAPSTGCSNSMNVGATALVPYTADYYFYKAGR